MIVRLLLALFLLLSFLAAFSQHKSTKLQKEAPIDHVQIELSKDDYLWIKNDLRTADELVAIYYNVKPEDPYAPQVLDFVFKIAVREVKAGTREGYTLVNSLGAAFGQYLVDNLDFRWIIVASETGREYSVRHDDSDWLIFPIQLIRTKLDSDETGFINVHYNLIEAQLEMEKDMKTLLGGPK